jgi:predicted GNAT family acetyltransferase
MLHVLKSYRRRGIAKALVLDLIQKIRALGLTPFTYIEPTNNASMSLMKSLGFVIDRSIHWVYLNR